MGVMQIPGHVHQKPREVSLDEIRSFMGNCRLCPLGSTRTNLVFGVGNPRARVMFVGEGLDATRTFRVSRSSAQRATSSMPFLAAPGSRGRRSTSRT